MRGAGRIGRVDREGGEGEREPGLMRWSTEIGSRLRS